MDTRADVRTHWNLEQYIGNSGHTMKYLGNYEYGWATMDVSGARRKAGGNVGGSGSLEASIPLGTGRLPPGQREAGGNAEGREGTLGAALRAAGTF